MLIKEKTEKFLQSEEVDSLEMIILRKKHDFFDSLSESSLKKKMIKEMTSPEHNKIVYLLPVGIIFVGLSILNKYTGYSEIISIILYFIGLFSFFLYTFPFVRKCILKFLTNEAKELLKNDIFMKSIVDNEVLKLFVKKYGKEVLAQIMLGKEKITYNDLYNYHHNHDQRQQEYKKVHEVIDCIENIK